MTSWWSVFHEMRDTELAEYPYTARNDHSNQSDEEGKRRRRRRKSAKTFDRIHCCRSLEETIVHQKSLWLTERQESPENEEVRKGHDRTAQNRTQRRRTPLMGSQIEVESRWAKKGPSF